jgi:hypothetical protein
MSYNTYAGQEHIDHVAGSSTELRNTHDLSSLKSMGLGDLHLIARAKGLGLFVVVEESPCFCRHTDGLIRNISTFICAFPTRESAVAKATKLATAAGENNNLRYSVV